MSRSHAVLTYSGNSRNNLTSVIGTSTTIDPAGTYKLADTQAARDATGFVYGVDHWAFTSTGIPKEILGSVLIANGGGDQFFCGDKGLAGYAAPQNAAANAKIIRALRVHTYIDSLYYADYQEMDWSETNE